MSCHWCGGIDDPEVTAREVRYGDVCGCWQCDVCGARGDIDAPVPMCAHLPQFWSPATLTDVGSMKYD